MTRIEAYFGCECLDLNHIARMSYWPPIKREQEEDDVIFLSVKTETYICRILPPIGINPLEWHYDLDGYFRFHILNRVPIALRYLFNSSYMRKYGVLESFDFQNKDLPTMRKFLSHLTNEETNEIDKDTILCWDNDLWRIRFFIKQIDKDLPYELNWEIQFLPRKIFGRIRYALKYIFKRYNDEQCFEITKKRAMQIEGLITIVENLNKEYEKNG